METQEGPVTAHRRTLELLPRRADQTHPPTLSVLPGQGGHIPSHPPEDSQEGPHKVEDVLTTLKCQWLWITMFVADLPSSVSRVFLHPH